MHALGSTAEGKGFLLKVGSDGLDVRKIEVVVCVWWKWSSLFDALVAFKGMDAKDWSANSFKVLGRARSFGAVHLVFLYAYCFQAVCMNGERGLIYDNIDHYSFAPLQKSFQQV